MRNLKTRKGFMGPLALLAILGILATLALQTNPLFKTRIEKERVDELIEKEKLIRDIFVKSSTLSKKAVTKPNELIKFAAQQKILPVVDENTEKNLAYWLNNGFGGEIKIFYEGGSWVNIGSNIPEDSFAYRYYKNSVDKTEPFYQEGKIIGHRYRIPLELAEILNGQAKSNPKFNSPLEGKQWKDEVNLSADSATAIRALNTGEAQSKSVWTY